MSKPGLHQSSRWDEFGCLGNNIPGNELPGYSQKHPNGTFTKH
jgi:hypothetical protein